MLGLHSVTKLASFLQERDQAADIFTTSSDLQTMVPRLLEYPPDLEARRKSDQTTCESWLAQILTEASSALTEPQSHDIIRLNPANESLYQLEMNLHEVSGELTRAIVHNALEAGVIREKLAHVQSEWGLLAITFLWHNVAQLVAVFRKLVSVRLLRIQIILQYIAYK